MTKIPSGLKAALAEGRLIPVVGAGFSMPSGLPGWGELLDDYIHLTDADTRPGFAEVRAQLAQPDLAELLDSFSLGDERALSYFTERFDDPRYEPSAYHALLREMGISTIVTTNWDTLVEQTFRETGSRVVVIADDCDVVRHAPNRQLSVIKLHGTITQASSLVYRKSQYEKYWDSRPLLHSMLSFLLGSNSALFLGYGFGDPNVLSLFNRLRQYLGRSGREHWVLSYGGGGLETVWRDLGINVLQVEDYAPEEQADNTRCTEAFLGALAGTTRSVSFTNLERAQLVNRELEELSRRARPHSVLRMRGSLGWLSNPEPIAGDPVYGTYAQDAAEHQMTLHVRAFLARSRSNVARCVLHVDVSPLLAVYLPRHLRRRLEALRANIQRSTQVEVVHSDHPAFMNAMLFDDDASLGGYKTPGKLGIARAFMVRDRQAVREEIRQFDASFDEALNHALPTLPDVCNPYPSRDALVQYARRDVLRRIDDEIHRLEWLEHGSQSSADEVDQHVDWPGIFARAVHYCMERHDGQTREDGTTPYWIHPFRVVERLRDAGRVNDYEVLIAALLHDVIEDCGVSADEIADEFGTRVASLVTEVTHPAEVSTATYISALARISRYGAAIKLADRWDNVWELRTKEYVTYGGAASALYMEESCSVLGACAFGSRTLAVCLERELRRAE